MWRGAEEERQRTAKQVKLSRVERKPGPDPAGTDPKHCDGCEAPFTHLEGLHLRPHVLITEEHCAPRTSNTKNAHL